MRTIKEPEERKAEILDAAEELFTTKGYNATTIIDILKKVEIAKGTFYYYFKSKEEVLDAIILRILNGEIAKAKKIVNDPNIPALQKMLQILLAQKPQSGGNKDKMIDQFHHPDNAQMHQKSLVQTILHFSPLLTQVVEQGIQEHSMSTDYPQEMVEFLLTAAQVIFDEGLFDWNEAEVQKKALAFVTLMESALGTPKGGFQDMIKVLL